MRFIPVVILAPRRWCWLVPQRIRDFQSCTPDVGLHPVRCCALYTRRPAWSRGPWSGFAYTGLGAAVRPRE